MLYTLESFEADLIRLLCKAEDSGLDPDALCEVAESILAVGWRDTDANDL